MRFTNYRCTSALEVTAHLLQLIYTRFRIQIEFTYTVNNAWSNTRPMTANKLFKFHHLDGHHPLYGGRIPDLLRPSS